MNAEYSKRALTDLRRIAEYHIAAGDPHVAEAVGSVIRQVVERLTRHPESGRPVGSGPECAWRWCSATATKSSTA